jgi:hypothetical protein
MSSLTDRRLRRPRRTRRRDSLDAVSRTDFTLALVFAAIGLLVTAIFMVNGIPVGS